jgi:hypothetical protein
MNFENTWYIIERHRRYEIASYAELSEYPSGEYLILHNFASRHEAFNEMRRLIDLEVKDTQKKLDALPNPPQFGA